MNQITVFPRGILTGAEVEKSSAYTVVTTTDSGKVFKVRSAVTFTLPSIAIGNVFTFVYTGVDGAANITISPAALDGITYAGTEVDNKDLILTLATAKRGDFVKLASLSQVVSWQVVDVKGIWVKEA